MSHNNPREPHHHSGPSNSRELLRSSPHNLPRDHHGGGIPSREHIGSGLPPILNPFEPQNLFPRPPFSSLRDPRDWNRLPAPGHGLSTLAGEPAFGNRFRTDNNSWRPGLPLHSINMHNLPQNMEFLHHWSRPPFLRPDVPPERPEESEPPEEANRSHRMFGPPDILRNSEQAVHQHFEESFRLAQQKGVWRSTHIKDERDKSPRPPMMSSMGAPLMINPGKLFEPLPSKPKPIQESRPQAGRSHPVPTSPSKATLQGRLPPHPYPHASDSKFMYHSDRPREIISPPVIRETDRAIYSRGGNDPPPSANQLQQYVSAGPAHRIKVSSPAPPQIYGKPFGAPSLRNYEPAGDSAPLSLISKVSTRHSETPPLNSGYQGHPNHQNMPNYMYNPSVTPSRGFPPSKHAPSGMSSTDDYQTQPLDLGGKRKQMESPNINVKKLRNESRPEQKASTTISYYPTPRFPIAQPRFYAENERSMGASLGYPDPRGMTIPQTTITIPKDLFLEQSRRPAQKPTTFNSLDLSREESRTREFNMNQHHMKAHNIVSENSPDTHSLPTPIVLNLGSIKKEKPFLPLSTNPTPSETPKNVEPQRQAEPAPPPNEVCRNSNSSTYSVHKLKKAWLERLNEEDTKIGILDNSPVLPNVSGAPSGNFAEHNMNSSMRNLSNNSPLSTDNNRNHVNLLTNVGNNGGSENNRAVHTKKKAAIRVRNMAGMSNGHDNRSSTDSDAEKVPAKRPRPKGKRKHLKEKRAKVSGSTSESAKDSDESRDGETLNEKNKSSKGSNEMLESGITSDFSSPSKKRGRKPREIGESTDGKESVLQAVDKKKPNPFKRPHTNLLKKTGQSFLQDGSCNEVAPKLGKCRECRWNPSNKSRKQSNIFCRFYAFRKLRYTKNGLIAIAGFSDPTNDPSEEDLSLWLPNKRETPNLKIDTAKFLLKQLGNQFCDLVQQENEAVKLNHFQFEKPTAWKRIVQGIREMCDVCDNTLFNFHWACGKCGFVVCINCFKKRREGPLKTAEEPGKDRDSFQWILCSNRQSHEEDKLMLTQSVAGDALKQIVDQLHKTFVQQNLPQHCHPELDLSPQVIDALKLDLNGLAPKEGQSGNDEKIDVSQSEPKSLTISAESNIEKDHVPKQCIPGSEEDEEGHSTLRELLIRPSNIPEKDENSVDKLNGTTEKSKAVIDTDTLATSMDHKACPLNEVPAGECLKLSVPLQRKILVRNGLPIIDSSFPSEVSKRHTNVPHSWLCGGRILHLSEPNHDGNYNIFQEIWSLRQPAIVSNLTVKLDQTLWNPEFFSKECEDANYDIIDCVTGESVPDEFAKKFWDGFQNVSKRPRDENGDVMMLKLKDFPSGEDFVEALPFQFKDFMAALPLSNYTHRNGSLNLVASLPDNFVKPDLGPKMCVSYGTELNSEMGSTNLRLNVMDNINLLVYVGAPQDCDNLENKKEILSAIKGMDCDVGCEGEIPGALWHIYNSYEADKIRDLLNKVSIERGNQVEPHHDPINDESWYLDTVLRKRLAEEYNVVGFPIVQCLGDAIIIPAGAPHQVRNLQSCIKISEDFVSPENISHSFQLVEDFRNSGVNHEDKHQMKSIVYHTVKEAISVLSSGSADMDVRVKGDDRETKSVVSNAITNDIIN